MSKTPKRPRDPNQLAKFVIDAATSENTPSVETAKSDFTRKRASKGGLSRATALTAEQRSEIAHVAAQARWKKS